MFPAVGQPALMLLMLELPPWPVPASLMEMLTVMVSPPPGWLKSVRTRVQESRAPSTTLRASSALAPNTAAKLSEENPRLAHTLVDGTVRSSSGSSSSRCVGRRVGRDRFSDGD